MGWFPGRTAGPSAETHSQWKGSTPRHTAFSITRRVTRWLSAGLGVPTGTSLRGLCPACLSHVFCFWGCWDKVPHAVAFGNRHRRRSLGALRAVGGPSPLPVGGRFSPSPHVVFLCACLSLGLSPSLCKDCSQHWIRARPEGPRSDSRTSVKTRLQIRLHSKALGAGPPQVGTLRPERFLWTPCSDGLKSPGSPVCVLWAVHAPST